MGDYTVKQRVPISTVSALMLARLLPHLQWRRHGIGVLQAYIHEGEYELRAHIWCRDLMLPGIDVSGNAHNHRFKMISTVYLGELEHVEYNLCQGRGFELYDFVHARQHTENNRSDMRKLPGEVDVLKHRMVIAEGERYTFERGAYHTSAPLSDVVVTLVEKVDQVERKAKVIAPTGIPPVPAFSGPPVDERPVVAKAVAALINRWAS